MLQIGVKSPRPHSYSIMLSYKGPGQGETAPDMKF